MLALLLPHLRPHLGAMPLHKTITDRKAKETRTFAPQPRVWLSGRFSHVNKAPAVFPPAGVSRFKPLEGVCRCL